MDFEAKAVQILEPNAKYPVNMVECNAIREISVGQLAGALRSAYDAGAEQMRERAARECEEYKGGGASAICQLHVETLIRALPLSDLNETGSE